MPGEGDIAGTGHPERALWRSERCCVSSRGALQAHADPSVIGCLHTLSRRIATVLQHEERRCQYLTREAKLILALQDEASAAADGERAGGFSWARRRAGSVLDWACPGHAARPSELPARPRAPS